MSIKKSLLALAVTALALMGFASSASAAVDGVLKDVKDGSIIPANRVMHFIGWAQFHTPRATYTCHVTAEYKATGVDGTTGDVTQFTIPDTSLCTGGGLLAGCKLKGHQTTNLPYHVTVTPTDFDVTGTIVIHNQFEGFLCPADITLTFSEITLKPLNTVNPRTVTGTKNKIGDTVSALKPEIAGVEISGSGTADGGPFGDEAATATGELELTEADRCTWTIN